MNHQWEFTVEVRNSFRDTRAVVGCHFYSEKAIHFESFLVQGSNRSLNGIQIFLNRQLLLEAGSKQQARTFLRARLQNVPPVALQWIQEHQHYLFEAIGNDS